MTQFSGKITTSGNSQSIRFEKALFQTNPEFRQQANVTAQVIAPGRLLVSVDENDQVLVNQCENDPLIETFLAFIAEDIRINPQHVKPLEQETLARVTELVKDVVVSDADVIPDDISF
jgi:hypothetical protein